MELKVLRFWVQAFVPETPLTTIHISRCGEPEYPAVSARVSAAIGWIQPNVCLKSRLPPTSCLGLASDLPLSLRVDIISGDTPWQLQNVSWGLYQIDPPLTIYEVDGAGVSHSDTASSSASTALSRKREGKIQNEQEADEVEEEAEEVDSYTSLYFPSLTAGLYYFRIEQDVADLANKGTYHHFRVVQGMDYDSRSWLEHAWFDADGTSFQGFAHQYIDLQSSRQFSYIQLPVTTTAEVQVQQQQMVTLTIDVFYDLAPTETAWELRNMDANEIITIVRLANVTQPGLVSYTMQVPMSTELQFRIWDLVGDGICCSDTKGRGWVEIWLGVRKMWQFDGVFEFELSATFRVQA
jgi:hypothetical protein